LRSDAHRQAANIYQKYLQIELHRLLGNMESIRLQNLRSLRDSSFIRLAPITLLVGGNSSGKSTFLRALPLLRQSAETATTGPILWYGNYVDYGSFTESVSSFTNEKEITLSFRIPVNSTHERVGSSSSLGWRRYPGYRIVAPENTTCDVAISIRGDGITNRNYVRSLELSLLNHVACLYFEEDASLSRFVVNGEEVPRDAHKRIEVRPGIILPRLLVRRDDFDLIANEQLSSPSSLKAYLFRESLVTCLRQFVHGNAKDMSIWSNAARLPLSDQNSMVHHIASLPNLRKGASDSIRRADSASPALSKLIRLLVASSVPAILNDCDIYISQFASRVHYAKPVRATAERYYRQQDLAVNEIDSDGRNVAMFLRSLSLEERTDFSNWLQSELNIKVSAQEDTGHVSLFVAEGGGEYNLADVGFGFSQLLPVVAHLWATQRSRGSIQPVPPTCFAIEQPELHLHPRIQAQLVDVFIRAVKSARKQGIDLRLIIETHSETMVNRIGSKIASSDLAPEDAMVVVFERKPTSPATEVSIASFDAQGALQNWPFGFFEPEL